MTEGKKKFKSLIRFHSANKINNYTGGRERKKKKKSKRIYRTSQNISIIIFFCCFVFKYFSCVTAVSILSLTGSHSSPHLPRMPSNTVLVSGPAVGAAQILIWSYSFVFLPPVSTAIRTRVFSFVGVFNGLLYIP